MPDTFQVQNDFQISENAGNRTFDPWMSSWVDSPAKALVIPEGRPDSQMTVLVSGLKCYELFVNLDRSLWLSKTSQLCFQEESTPFSGTWPKRGWMRNGHCYEPKILALRMKENDSLRLPTPTASMGKRGWGLSRTGRARYSQKIIDSAFQYGYKPPIALLEWEMGYPRNWTTANE